MSESQVLAKYYPYFLGTNFDWPLTMNPCTMQRVQAYTYFGFLFIVKYEYVVLVSVLFTMYNGAMDPIIEHCQTVDAQRLEA